MCRHEAETGFFQLEAARNEWRYMFETDFLKFILHIFVPWNNLLTYTKFYL